MIVITRRRGQKFRLFDRDGRPMTFRILATGREKTRLALDLPDDVKFDQHYHGDIEESEERRNDGNN